ncbi:MAG: hypothetical protein Q4G05_02585 [Clostridia bacterium]|nr:hypothetical protein [Clostridia bacterium]
MINKKVFFIVLSIIILCFFIFLGLNVYKKMNNGNNISKLTVEELTQYILNIDAYQAQVSVEVISNKNTNKYKLEQYYEKNKGAKQTVIEPEAIAGMQTTLSGGVLKLTNTKMDLTKLYENCPDVSENNLWLSTFIDDYNRYESKQFKEKNNEIVMSVKLEESNNKYNIFKELYIDKVTHKPTKMLIQDINQNKTVYIEYNEIEINNVNEDILAFKL